jgi:hypothetical protein
MKGIPVPKPVLTRNPFERLGMTDFGSLIGVFPTVCLGLRFCLGQAW